VYNTGQHIHQTEKEHTEMATVLLANPCGPYPHAWGEDVLDFFGSRLSRGQGVFTFTSHSHCWALYMIAENINASTTVLEYSHLDEFEEELKKNYDYVGIQIIGIYTPIVAKMVESVRRVSPRSKIVIGGYGVAGLDDPVPHDPEDHAGYILNNADYLCREEGVRFFRRLLDDPPYERAITQFHMPMGGTTIKGFEFLPPAPVPTILVALGCTGGCEFCNTSAFFKAQKIVVADPDECYRFMSAAMARMPKFNGAPPPINMTLFDEDLLLDKDYVLRLGHHMREGGLIGETGYFCFASMKSVSQFDLDELAASGMDTVWIGVESTYEKVVSQDHRFVKRGGNELSEVFRGLHERGISTVASFILGLDFQTPENIDQDIENLVGMRPVMYQIAPYTPCPGTPFYQRVKKEGRLLPEYTWSDIQIWKDDVYQTKNFPLGELRKVFNKTHDELMRHNGPTVLNMLHVALCGYERYRNHHKVHFQRRAEYLARKAQKSYAALKTVKEFAATQEVRDKVDELEKRYIRLLGQPDFGQKFIRELMLQVMKRQRKLMEQGLTEVASDPPVRWTYYTPGNAAPPKVVRTMRKRPSRLRVLSKPLQLVANL
jgi:haloalkane dehalogenase